MSWPEALALFGMTYTMAVLWDAAQRLADEIAGHPVIADSAPIAANSNTIRGVPTP